MAGSLAGKRCLVTGAGQGIGRAIATAFAAEGGDVWGADLDSTKLADLGPGSGINPVSLDVRDGPAIEQLAARIGPVQILANCAGLVLNGSVLECSDADWQACMEINARGMFLSIRAFLPGMLAQGGGRIINIASTQSSLAGSKRRLAYSASKGAVIGLTKSVAADFAAQGIRCNAICPGAVESPSWLERTAASPDPAATRRITEAAHPVGRLGRPEEIAALAVFLASEAADFMTGSAVVMDGGGIL